MDADPKLVAFVHDFTAIVKPMYEAWEGSPVESATRPDSVAECLSHDILLLGQRILGLDAFGKKAEMALVSELLTLIKPHQGHMPYEYNLSVTDGILKTEMEKWPANSDQSAKEVMASLWSIKMFEAWVARNGGMDEKATDFVTMFQELLTQLVFRDGQLSPEEVALLKPFDDYFSRYVSPDAARSVQSF
jgi:hypothetical protein